MAKRTLINYNLADIRPREWVSKWDMPIIYKEDFIPTDLIGFNYAKTNKNKNTGIHFYLDDYQFERVWNEPKRYIKMLKEYECILTPDFSLYLDMPLPMKLWNTYRNRYLGWFYQNEGIRVIPTLSWGEEKTLDFAFKGIEKGGTVSVSTIGVKRDKKALEIWEKGMQKAIEEIEPTKILVYGGEIDFDYGDIEVAYYGNKNIERFEV